MKMLNKVKAWKLNKAINILNEENAKKAKLSETKFGEPVLVFHEIEKQSDQITFTLLYTDIRKLYRSTLLAKISGDGMFIQDIKVLDQPSYSPKNKEPFGKGYGTVLMEMAIDFAIDRELSFMTGNMVSNSTENTKRQIGYYKKHGFSINENRLHKEM